MKKLLVFTLVMIVFTFSISLAASIFPDTVNTKYDSAVEKLTKLNVITGFPDGYFKPEESVTRAQLAKMLVEILKLQSKSNALSSSSPFTDVSESHWAYSWILISAENKLIVGYPDKSFGPDNTVTYAECMAMLLRALKLEDGMLDKTWPAAYMAEAKNKGLLNDVDSAKYANPNTPADRGETSVALYNMTVKLEKQSDDVLAESEAEKKAQEEAKKNALDFDIVTSTSYSKSTYYVKLKGDSKNKYEVASLLGKTSLSSSKVEALKDTVIGYKEDKDGAFDIQVSFKPSSFDKATNITKVENGSTLTLKNKEKIDFSNTTTKKKYSLYQFIRVNADYDEKENDGLIYFVSVKDLGIGSDGVKFNKNERVLIDSTNEIFILLNGIDSTAVISKGKIDSDADEDDDESTGDYSYGWVNKVTTKNKIDFVTIGKTVYEVYSKSKDFIEDTFVCFEAVDEDDDGNDIVKLSRTFDATLLDGSAKVIDSVSGSKGSQRIRYKGDTTDTNYYSTTNTVRYKSYEVVVLEVEEDSDGTVYVSDYDEYNSLSDVKFAVGDRTVIDTTRKVFAIYQGLSASKIYKNGKYSSTVDDTTYTISYKWSDNKGPEGGSLPANATVNVNSSYTAKLPTLAGYTFTANPAKIDKVTKNATITISFESDLEKAQREVEEAQAAVDTAQSKYNTCLADVKAASGDLRDAERLLEDANEVDIDALEAAMNDAKTEYDNAKDAWENAESGDAKIAAEEAMDEAESEYKAAKKEYDEAVADKNRAQQKVTTATSALTAAKKELTKAETALEDAKETLRQKQAALDELS